LAEDLLQDSFHDALRSAAQLAEVRNPEAWLFGIARHRALRALRRRRRFGGVLGRLSAAS
jgi:DNA-directed RNA polymerase specialized sigma24 family protein